MSSEESNSLLVKCPGCQVDNEPGMLFCVFCGKALLEAAERIRATVMPAGNKCPTCGKEDNLNMRFCVFCSAPIYPEMRVSRPLDKFSWEMDLVDDPPKARAAADFKKAVRTAPKKKSGQFYLPGAILLGLVLGAAAAYPFQDNILRVVASTGWPAKSLVVYTDHPQAQVSLEHPDGNHFTVGQTDHKGTLRFQNLEPGDYKVRISAPKCRTSFGAVTIEGDRATVLGFQQPVHLIPETPPTN